MNQYRHGDVGIFQAVIPEEAKQEERLLKIVDELHRHDAQDFRVLAEGSGKSTLVSEIDLTEPKGRKRLGIPEEEK